MPKDRDEGNKRIEGLFGQIGLGNFDPEKLAEYLERYDQAMETASQVKARTGKQFKEVLKSETEKEESNKDEPPEEEKPK